MTKQLAFQWETSLSVSIRIKINQTISFQLAIIFQELLDFGEKNCLKWQGSKNRNKLI